MAISTALAVSVALSVALSLALPALLSAQRRPGVAMGFYTTTGLVTGEVEGGSVTSSTALASSPSFEASFLLTAPLKKLPKRAWIVGVRARALALGDNDYCSVRPEPGGCRIRRFDERAALLAGGAFDIPPDPVIQALIWIVGVTTALSGASYLVKWGRDLAHMEDKR